MGKIFGKPYAQTFVEGLSSDAKASFASALDDNGDFLRVDLDLGPTALQETYEEDACAKCALSFGGKELQGVICYASETTYDFVSYEPQDEMRFWEIDAETCELTEIVTHERVTLGDLRLALGGGSGGGFDPSEIPEGDILQNAVLGLNEDGEAVKGNLYGKYVRVADAPLSIDLSEEFEAALDEGIFINGDMIGFHNPVLFPLGEGQGGAKVGLAIGPNNPYTYTPTISRYFTYQHKIYKGEDYFRFEGTAVFFKDKKIPEYPTNTAGKSYHYVFKNGSLAWHEGNGLYLHTVVFTVSGSSGNITLTILSDSATPIAFDADTGNIVAENSSFIQFANCGNFVFTRFGANGFNPAIYEFDTATGTFSNAITLATVDSDTVTPIG